jgi:Transposase DDE domain
MTITVTTLATALQTLFTTTAQRVGRATHFIRRQRDLTAADFAQTLVFGWIDQPTASLESFALRLDLSAQALHQRMGPAAHAFFKELIARALAQVVAAPPTRGGLLRRFGAVVVEDSSTVALPADLAPSYRGHGGSDAQAGQAALKVLVRWELLTGQLLALQCVPAVTADSTLAADAAELPKGALHLADQGFFDTQRWKGYTDRFWISRVPAGVAVAVDGTWQPLTAWLESLTGSSFDGRAQLVRSQQLTCRLTARRCPPEVAARRRQKLREYTRSKKGREPSVRQLVACDWLVLATNVPATRLDARELWVVYRCRWQVELLFKRGKQQLGWTFSHGRTGDRVLTEVLAKLLATIVVLWATLLRGGSLEGRSPTKQGAVVRRFALRMLDQLAQPATLAGLMEQMQQELGRLAPQPCRRKHPSTRQLLLNPKLAG